MHPRNVGHGGNVQSTRRGEQGGAQGGSHGPHLPSVHFATPAGSGGGYGGTLLRDVGLVIKPRPCKGSFAGQGQHCPRISCNSSLYSILVRRELRQEKST